MYRMSDLFSVLHQLYPLATREKTNKKRKKTKKNEKTDDTDETKRNGRKRSGWDDDPSRARGEEIAPARARAMEGVRRAGETWREGETNRDLFGRVRGRCARCDERPVVPETGERVRGKDGWTMERGERGGIPRTMRR